MVVNLVWKTAVLKVSYLVLMLVQAKGEAMGPMMGFWTDELMDL